MVGSFDSSSFQDHPSQQQQQQHGHQHTEQALHIVRERQWMYLGPIAAAPLAHIGVTLYRSAKTPLQKKVVIGGIIGSTVLAVGMRMVLMVHAGYPGGPNTEMALREKVVNEKEKQRIENATVMDIVKGAARGFG